MTLLEECYLERDRWILLSIMPPSPSLIIGLQVPDLLLNKEGKFRLGDTTWYGEGFLFVERVNPVASLFKGNFEDRRNAR